MHEQTRLPLRPWLIGLAIFALVVLLGIWLRSQSIYGIVDHQLAGTAEQVDAIQDQWRAEGVRWLAILAMLGDLVFIGVYGWGAWVVGRALAARDDMLARVLGWTVALAAVLFLITDYAETVLQFIQLVRSDGSDTMARIAASMQGTKIASWIASFVGVLAAIVLNRFSLGRA
ncbi:hypothetical protein [Qipengyuania nanhaisediminis]|uniref:hypothetical protein n=1 Tax=Qipengyuania nanhaisediminis TaxID=604088 RepID=UPI0038B273C6